MPQTRTQIATKFDNLSGPTPSEFAEELYYSSGGNSNAVVAGLTIVYQLS